MTHIKRQKLILSTYDRGYNTHFLLYPQPPVPELIKLSFAVLYASWTMGLTLHRSTTTSFKRCLKTVLFNRAAEYM